MGAFDITTLDVAALTELREASNDLFKYVTFLSKNKTNETAPSTSNLNAELAQFVEILLGNSQSIPLWGDKLVEKIGTKPSIYGVDITGADRIKNTSGSFGLTSGLSSSYFTPRKPITLFTHKYDRIVDSSNTNSDLSALFLSIIPPVEMSLCVPYVDIQFIMPIIYSSIEDGATTVFKESEYYPMTLASHYGALSKTFQTPKSKTVIISSSQAKLPSYVSGMEMFQSPQTMNMSYSNMLNKSILNGIPILDTLSPPASLKSLSIDQISPGGGSFLSTTTKVEMKIVVHDRSRLAELEPIISAELFPTTSIRITWGWSHPDKNKFSNNKFAKFINAMRYTQDFIVAKVNISAAQSTNVEVGISLVSVGSFNAANAKLVAAGGNILPVTVLQSYISNIEKYFAKATASSTKVGSDAVLAIDKKYNSATLISFNAFKNLKDNVSKSLSDGKVNELKKIVDTFMKDNSEDLNTTDKYSDEVNGIGVLSEIERYSIGSIWPYFSNFNESGDIKPSMAVLNTFLKIATDKMETTMPLYSAIIRFVASPLAACLDDIDEVRIHLMSFNGAAGYFACENIGMFPIDIAQFNKSLFKETAESMIKKIAQQASAANSIYFGYNSVYESNKLDPDITDEKAKEAAAKQASENKNKLFKSQSEEIYKAINKNISKLVTSAVEFVPPKIKYKMEIIPAYDESNDSVPPSSENSNKKIFRIIVYDDNSTGSFKDGATILALTRTAGISEILGDGGSILSSGVVDIVSNTDGSKILKLKNDKKLLRKYFTTLFPTIVIGGEGSLITGAQFTSGVNNALQDRNILRGIVENENAISQSKDSGSSMAQDVDILPGSLTVTMIGNPLMSRGQVYYVDFGTGTTIDNAYTVQKVSHTIDGGSFKTSVTMGPSPRATMKSAIRTIETLFGAKAKETTVTEVITSTEADDLHRR